MGDGLGKALSLLGDQASPSAEAEQLALIADDEPDADLPLVASTPGRSGAKGGRPKGRMNRSTEQWVSVIQSRYRSPLIGLAEIWSRPVAELARELELYRYGSDGRPLLGADGKPLLNLVEAFKLQQSAMVNALPYLHSRMPQALQVEGAKSAGVIVFTLGDGAPQPDESATLNLQDYQEVSGDGVPQSDGEKVG